MMRNYLFYLLLSCALAFPQKRVLAFYYPWYGTPSVSGNWVHWNEAGHNPEILLGDNLPDSATTNHPLKLYDSNDPEVIKKHLSLAKWARIDALIYSWWGMDDFTDRAFRKALRIAEKEKGIPVKLTIYYETVSQVAVDKVEATVKDLMYILNEYADSPAFFKVGNKPVIFIYGRAMGQLGSKWRDVIDEVKRLRKGNVLFIADSLDSRWLDVFDGLHEYNPIGAILAKADMYKRYRSCKEICSKRGKISCATVIPGYDDSNVRQNNPIVRLREDGKLYQKLWEDAIKADVDWVLICSFNEWHEGTEIEPSVEYGKFYLQLTREYANRFKKGR
ncbi:MAG: glycoside hydrolase family 99-like domain-containing protein [bacterium]